MEEFILKLINDTKLNFNTVSLIKTGIILLLTVAAIITLTIIYRKLRAKKEKENDVRKTYAYRIVYRIIRALIIVTGIVAVLQTAGINLIGISAGFGLLILLLAFAVKDALQDIFAGIVIMSDRVFNVGDAVEFEGKEGIVISFTARTTKIEFLEDRSVLSVANRNISKIRKLTHLVDIDLPLPYELSGKKAYSVLGDICEKIKTLEAALERIEALEKENAGLKEELEYFKKRKASGRQKHNAKWTAIYNNVVECYENGMTIEEIAKRNNISKRSVYRYKAFYDGLNKSRQE